jgi:hypothetical protein
MKVFSRVLTATFLLIGIVLVLNKAPESVAIVNSLAGNAVKGIKTLQARA